MGVDCKPSQDEGGWKSEPESIHPITLQMVAGDPLELQLISIRATSILSVELSQVLKTLLLTIVPACLLPVDLSGQPSGSYDALTVNHFVSVPVNWFMVLCHPEHLSDAL